MTTAADDPTTALAAVTEQPDVAVPAPRTAAAGRSRVELIHGAAGSVVTVHGPTSRRTASVLSCRLHEAVAGADTTVVVDLGDASAADPSIERVLVCARDSAADRGLAFHVR